MYRQVNKADLENAILALNDRYLDLIRAVPAIEMALNQNATTVFVIQALLNRTGVNVDTDWCRRLATYCSLKGTRPIPKDLVLLDDEFTKFVLICSQAGWI